MSKRKEILQLRLGADGGGGGGGELKNMESWPALWKSAEARDFFRARACNCLHSYLIGQQVTGLWQHSR